MKTNNDLKDRIVLITGAGSGIGRQTASSFAAQGALVVVSDMSIDMAQATASEIGHQALALKIDVTSTESIEAGLEKVKQKFGGLDILVNNAGIDTPGIIAMLSEEDWDRIVNTNLKSVFLMAKAVWPLLVARGGGLILNTASICAFWGVPEDGAYCAAKAGVVMLSKVLALEGAKSNIRVNCVCPGYTRTPMLEKWIKSAPDPDAVLKEIESIQPLGRLGQPKDIADGFIYLAKTEWVTGSSLVIDGGAVIGLWRN